MSLTPSTMLPLGTLAPEIDLRDVVTGEKINISTFDGKKALLIMFIARHCPYVQHVKEEIARLGHDYQSKSVGIVAICASDIESYPMDAPDSLKDMARELNLTFPVCFDESQSVAKSYTAACTPDIFLFDEKRHLVYRGQLDDSRPGNNIPVTGKDLRAAIDNLLSDKPIDPNQKPSIGCSIKWIPGNEPSYYK